MEGIARCLHPHQAIQRKTRRRKSEKKICVTCDRPTLWVAIQPNYIGNCWGCTITLAKAHKPYFVGQYLEIEEDDNRPDSDEE